MSRRQKGQCLEVFYDYIEAPYISTYHHFIAITFVRKESPTVKKALNEDIYNLTVIQYAKYKRLPVGLCIISIMVFSIQILGLIGLSLGYQLENNMNEINIYTIQYMSYVLGNDTTYIISLPDETRNVVALRQTGTYWGQDEDLSVITPSGTLTDPNKFDKTERQLNRTKNFVGFVSVFILMIYMMQSIGSYAFLWNVPEHIEFFRRSNGIKYCCKIVAVINILMAWISWIIAIWTLFNDGSALDIIDMIMTPLGIVFILEVDDWAVSIYLMLEFEEDDDDEDYDGGEELWVVDTTKFHMKQFKRSLLTLYFCLLLPPVIYFIMLQSNSKIADFWRSDTDMYAGGLAVVTYILVISVILIACITGFILKRYRN